MYTELGFLVNENRFLGVFIFFSRSACSRCSPSRSSRSQNKKVPTLLHSTVCSVVGYRKNCVHRSHAFNQCRAEPRQFRTHSSSSYHKSPIDIRSNSRNLPDKCRYTHHQIVHSTVRPNDNKLFPYRENIRAEFGRANVQPIRTSRNNCPKMS